MVEETNEVAQKSEAEEEVEVQQSQEEEIIFEASDTKEKEQKLIEIFLQEISPLGSAVIKFSERLQVIEKAIIVSFIQNSEEESVGFKHEVESLTPD